VHNSASIQHANLTPAVRECLDMLRAVSADAAMNEEARKLLFFSRLHSVFPEPQYAPKLDALAAGAETYVEPSRGFIDTRNGQLVIEAKRNLLLRAYYDEAQNDLKRYIAGLWTEEGIESSFCCVGTDILRWHVWRPTPLMTPHDGCYDADMVSLEKVEILDASELRDEDAHHLVLLLKRLLIDENLMSLTAKNLHRDFGLGSTQFALWEPILRDIIERAAGTPEVELAMDLWGKHQTYNAMVLNIDLYLKHIYLVILSRLMVAACFEEHADAIVDDGTILDILSGSFFTREIRLANFVERDFFGWMIAAPWINDFLPLARQLYHNLRAYDFATVSGENVLRLIYDELMPAQHQALLGQQSTPEPLVSLIVHTLVQDREPDYRFLDPACGSGTFLCAALCDMRGRLEGQNLSPSQQLSRLKDSVTGIDVDPISVILSKTAWALTLSDLLPFAAEPVSIPIYHADSLFVATDQTTAGTGDESTDDSFCIDFDGTVIQVPIELLSNVQAFSRLVQWCYTKAAALADESVNSGEPLTIAEPDIIHANLAAILSGSYSGELAAEAEALAVSAAELVNAFGPRILKKRNGIWAFILRNSYLPSLLAGRFDVIASNPPWLAMSKLQDIPYKEQLLQQAESFGIKPTGSSFLHAEIATTFLLHSVSQFLAEEGQAAFVLTRSVFDGDQHDEFRSLRFVDVVPFAITEIWDLHGVDNLFKIPSCVVFGTKDAARIAASETPIPARYWSELGDLSGASSGSIVLARLGQKTAWVRSDSTTPVAISHGYYKRMFRQGADLMPRTALFVELCDDNPAQTVVGVRTSGIEVANPQAKVFRGRRFGGSVNQRYLFSTVTSNALLPFIVLEDHLPTVLLPIELQNDEIRILSRDELIDQGDVGTAEWFATVDEEIGLKKIRARIDVRGKLSQQRYAGAQFVVHYGAGGTHPCAGIQQVDPRSQRPFIADQTTYVFAPDDENEAYYLTGMLNAPLLARIINPFQAKGDFGARHVHKLPTEAVPEYNPADLAHQTVAQLSRQATAAARAALDDQVCDLACPIAQRRALLRERIEQEVEAVNEAVREVLMSPMSGGDTGR